MHEYHRKRQKQKFVLHGADVFHNHELLEMLLYYSIARKNTNDIAHALISRFGSLRGVFEASIPELCTVEGIGEYSATLIKLAGAMGIRTSVDTADARGVINSYSAAKSFLIELFQGESKEKLYLISLNNSFRILDCKCISEGEVNYAATTVSVLTRPAVKNSASAVILAHNHPEGIAVPSVDDIDATVRIKEAFGALDIKFIDHFVVAKDRCTPILHDSEE